MSQQKQVAIGDAFSYGWETTKNNFGFFVGIFVTVILVNLIPAVLSEVLSDDAPFLSSSLSLLGAFAGVFLGIGVIIILLKFVDKQEASFNNLFAGGKYFLSYFLGSILVGILIAIGLILLVIPGIYLILRFMFFGFYIVDKNQGVIDALKSTSELTNGIKMDLFIFGLVAVALNLLGLICLVVGLLVTIPMTELALAYIYRSLQPQTEKVPAAEISAG